MLLHPGFHRKLADFAVSAALEVDAITAKMACSKPASIAPEACSGPEPPGASEDQLRQQHQQPAQG